MTIAAKVLISALLPSLLAAGFSLPGSETWGYYYRIWTNKQTVADIQESIGARIEAKLLADFNQSGISSFPEKIILIAYKNEKEMELWTQSGNSYAKVKTYKILASSGSPGPKLKEGDKQIPEGMYRIEKLNPNSTFHLSMKLDYPNDFDRAMARADRRDNPGSDIYIHGKEKSVGCLAIGDEAIEELFILAAKIGIENVKVIISPDREIKGDPRQKIRWKKKLYSAIRDSIHTVSGIKEMQGKKSRRNRSGI